MNEAVQTQQDLKSVFFTHMELLEGLPVEQLTAKGVKLYKVKSNHMKVWSDTVTPQGIIGEFNSLRKIIQVFYFSPWYVGYLINFYHQVCLTDQS